MSRVVWTVISTVAFSSFSLLMASAGVTRAAPAAGDRPVRGTVVSLDATSLVLREDGANKDATYRFTKSPSFWRFGNADALVEDFKAGDRVTAWFPAKGKQPLAVTDEITELLQQGQCYKVVAQDRDNYRFTVQRVALGTGADVGKLLAVEYARPTFLVLREKPEFVFRVEPGMRLWINTTIQRNAEIPVAREVLDEVSRVRFERQQQLRAAARKAPTTGPVSYQKDIWPILEVNCLSCHKAGNAQSGYSLSSPDRLRSGGPRGVAVTPGKSSESLLYTTMTGDRNPRMPPDRDPTPEQLALIKRWIDAGAVMDEEKLK